MDRRLFMARFIIEEEIKDNERDQSYKYFVNGLDKRWFVICNGETMLRGQDCFVGYEYKAEENNIDSLDVIIT